MERAEAVPLPEDLTPYLPALPEDHAQTWQGFVGLILIAVTLWMPVGVAGGARSLWRRLFITRSREQAR